MSASLFIIDFFLQGLFYTFVTKESIETNKDKMQRVSGVKVTAELEESDVDMEIDYRKYSSYHIGCFPNSETNLDAYLILYVGKMMNQDSTKVILKKTKKSDETCVKIYM